MGAVICVVLLSPDDADGGRQIGDAGTGVEDIGEILTPNGSQPHEILTTGHSLSFFLLFVDTGALRMDSSVSLR